MITVFNRREVTITRSLERLAAVRNALEAGGIDYSVRPDGFASAGRGRGMAGIRQEAVHTYRVYVHKASLEKALHLVREAK